jgi:hypothetical protein
MQAVIAVMVRRKGMLVETQVLAPWEGSAAYGLQAEEKERVLIIKSIHCLSFPDTTVYWSET